MEEYISNNERNAFQKRRLQNVIENTIKLENTFNILFSTETLPAQPDKFNTQNA